MFGPTSSRLASSGELHAFVFVVYVHSTPIGVQFIATEKSNAYSSKSQCNQEHISDGTRIPPSPRGPDPCHTSRMHTSYGQHS